MTILQGDNGAAGGAATPKIFAAATIKYTGTLRSFFQRKFLTDFTITEVDGTFVSQSVNQKLSFTNLVGSLDSPASDHTTGEYTNTAFTTVTGGGSGGQATVTVGAGNTITSIIVTTQGSGYDEGEEIRILGSVIGGSNEDITLGIGDLETTFTKQRLDLTHIFLEAEDADDTSSFLRFKIHNTLTYRLFYKNSLLVRIYDNL